MQEAINPRNDKRLVKRSMDFMILLSLFCNNYQPIELLKLPSRSFILGLKTKATESLRQC